MSDVENTLKLFGLTEVEIKVYLSTLTLGTKQASIIAKHTELKRGQTYNVLRTLVEKGLIQELEKNQVLHFSAIKPENLLQLIETKFDSLKDLQTQLRSIIPFLQSLQSPFSTPPKVRFFNGISGVKEVYEEMLATAEPIYAFVDFEAVFPQEKDPMLNQWLWNYAQRRAQKGIWFYGITNKSKASDKAFKLRKKQKREMKLLEKSLLPVEIAVFADKIAFMSSSQDSVAVIIEHQPTATSLHSIHQVLWNILPKYS